MSSKHSPPDIILMVEWNATLSYLKYILILNGGAWRRQFTMTLEHSDPATFAANFYRRIAALVEHKDPASAVIRNRSLEISPNDVDQRIMHMGHYLWESLLPAEFRKLYADNREQWRDKTLLISSDEPSLPWELIWPYDEENGEWYDNGPWCITTRLTRWLYRDEKGNGNEEPPDVLRLGKAALIAPIYKHLDNLPLAKIEQNTLSGLFGQCGIASVAPTQATWQTVIDLLKFGDCDWVHVAAHGSFYSSEPEGNSAIWLEEDVALTPENLSGSEMTRYFKEKRPAFVINACEIGRQGWGVTRIGGWANRLVRLKARLFIAPLWAVSDLGATSFSTAFYRLLLQGETVGTAVRQARLESQRKGDPTWLAYSVYAHPNAILEIINE